MVVVMMTWGRECDWVLWPFTDFTRLHLQVVPSIKALAQDHLGFDNAKNVTIECVPAHGLQSMNHSAIIVVMQAL